MERESYPSPSNKRVGSNSQRISSLLCSVRGDPYGFQSANEFVNRPATKSGHAKDGEEVPDATNVFHFTGNWVVPRDGVIPLGKILVEFKLEARRFDGTQSL